MMKTYLKRAFQLSDSGVKGLAKSIWSFFLYYVSFVPPMICVFLFADRLLNGNTGKPVVYLLFMLAATLVMYLVINYNYKTTYDETYQESANLRIDLAEQLSKLPLSYFSKHNLSDLAQTIMADVASIEHAFANAVANSIGFAIYFLVISVALLIMNWKLGLCVLLPVLTSASVLFLTKKLQVRDVNKHYDRECEAVPHKLIQLQYTCFDPFLQTGAFIQAARMLAIIVLAVFARHIFGRVMKWAAVYPTASGFLTGLRHHQLLQRLQRRVSHEIVRHKRTPL